ncbi:MAG: DUF1385 domain-containing protein [Dehalococcoidia bacterium]|nr:DUF1385 domain-containing protein [Dehalococcoidia bacterium]
MAKRFHYGGQAVMEGVMMRGPKQVKVSVRRPDGEIVSQTEPLSSIYTGRLRQVFLLRGIFALIEMLVLGIKTLMYSANVALEAELEEKPKPVVIWIPMVFGLAFGIALFVILPMLITNYGVDKVTDSSILSNLADGLIRVLFLIAYMASVSLIPDIRRVFAYHGAEHKTVNAYEAGAPLEVSEVQKYSTAHSRCGTGFLLIVMMIALVVFVFTGQPALWIRLLSRIILLPIIAAFGYELIHFTADRMDNSIVKTLMRPSLALQALTTRQPDDQMVAVAIEALNGVLEPEAIQQPSAG